MSNFYVLPSYSIYFAIQGKFFIRGQAAERFCVRNSGANAVAEGCGDHGCEYMTGGTVIILGDTGRNFAAGMSGGIAYVYDPHNRLDAKCNKETVGLERLDSEDDVNVVKCLVYEFVERTRSSSLYTVIYSASFFNSIAGERNCFLPSC